MGATMTRAALEALCGGRRVLLVATAIALAGCDSARDPLGTAQRRLSADESATESETKFDFHIGDAFLQSLGFSAGTKARAANGDVITVIGTGEIEVGDGEAEGKGTFEHRSSTGALLASGTWEAKELLSFTDFGTQSGLPPTFHGGSAVIRIEVVGHPAATPATTVEFEATLTVDCKIGSFPAGFKEGITFSIDGGLNFDEKVSGVTVFVAEAED